MTTIVPRRGTAAEWVTANPVLAMGELGYEIDTQREKRGDGATAWNALPYSDGEVGSIGIATIGQSNNLAGLGLNTLLDVPNPRVKQWPGIGTYLDTEIAGVEPFLHTGGQATNCIGYGSRLADRVARATPQQNNVTVIPCGVGGTGIYPQGGNTWDPADVVTPNNLFNQACARIDAFLAASPANRLDLVCWQQGEHDTANSTTVNAYAAGLARIVNALRTKYGAGLKILIGSMVPDRVFTFGPSTYRQITAIHADAARVFERVWFFYGPFGHYRTDDVLTAIHYDAAGQRILGERYWDAYNRFVTANVAGTDPSTPAGVSLSQAGNTIQGFIDRNPGRVTNFLIEYKVNAGAWSTLVRDSIDPYFEIPGMTLGTTVQVRVSSINAGGTSAPCTPATIVLDSIPGQVTGLTVGTPGPYSLPTSWAALTGARSFILEYKAHSSSVWLTAATGITDIARVVAGLQAATPYDLRVTAVNYAGAGIPSATVTATTADPTSLATAIGLNPVSAYGLRRLRAAYSGPLIRVRRSSDGAEQDIGIATGGALDVAAATAFAAGGDLFIRKLYDQSGNGREAGQTDTTKQPRIMFSGVLETKGGVPAMYFDGGDFLTATSTGIAANGAGSMLMICTPPGNNNIPSVDYGSPAALLHLWSNGDNLSTQIRNDASTTVNLLSAGGKATGTALHQYSAIYNPTLSGIYQDAVTITTGAMARSGTYTTTALAIGSWAGSLPFTGHISEVAYWLEAFTTEQRQNGEANQRGYGGTP